MTLSDGLAHQSMDGLPGMRRGVEAGRRDKVTPIKKMVGALANPRYHVARDSHLQMVLVAVISFLLGALLVANASLITKQVQGLDVNFIKNLISTASA